MDKTQICNMGLRQCSNSTISGFQEDSPKAADCRLVWSSCRDMALSYHDWSFARRISPLVLSNEEIDNYKYVYVYPSDCLVIRKIYDKEGNEHLLYPLQEKKVFDILVSQNKSEKLIATDLKLARITYTAIIDNTELWPSPFCDAMASLIASKIVKGETGASTAEKHFQNFVSLIDLAKTLDIEEIRRAVVVPRPKSSFMPFNSFGNVRMARHSRRMP